AVYIGDQAVLESGYLEAGEPAPIAVLLDEPITQSMGDALLADVSYQHAVAGQTLESPITYSDMSSLSVPVAPGGWDLTGSNMVVYLRRPLYPGGWGSVVPEGAVVTRIASGTLPAGYVVPASLPTLPTPIYTFTAGQPAPMDTVLSAGTVLAAGVTLDRRVAIQSPLNLAADFFDKGFGHYNVVGQYGVTVAEGTQVNVTRPVLRMGEQARGLVTGSDTSLALQQWLAPLYIEDPITSQLTQRQGASLSLQAG